MTATQDLMDRVAELRAEITRLRDQQKVQRLALEVERDEVERQKADNVALYEENQTLQWAAAEVKVLKAEVEHLRLTYSVAEGLTALNETLATRHIELDAEVERLREENKQLRRAYESDEEAIKQATEVVRLRRIEEAATRLADHLAERPDLWTGYVATDLADLRAALGEGSS